MATKAQENTLLWITGGAVGLGVGLYFLLKDQAEPVDQRVDHPEDQIAPVAPLEPPASFASLNAIDVRYKEVKELWTMGYIEAEPAKAELIVMRDEAINYQATDLHAAQTLIGKLEKLYRDIEQWVIDTAQPPAAAMTGFGPRQVAFSFS